MPSFLFSFSFFSGRRGEKEGKEEKSTDNKLRRQSLGHLSVGLVYPPSSTNRIKKKCRELEREDIGNYCPFIEKYGVIMANPKSKTKPKPKTDPKSVQVLTTPS